MARKQASPADLNELEFGEEQLSVLPLRDGHLVYLDPHLLPLLGDEIRSISELGHLHRPEKLEAIDELLIWRWLNSAWKRRLVTPVPGFYAPGGERCWELTGEGEKRIGVRAMLARISTTRTVIMAVVGPVIAAFGGVAGFLATVQSSPVIAFVLLGFAVGMVNRLVLFLIQHAWLRGHVVLARAIEKESALQACLKSGASSPVPPASLPSLKPAAAGAALLTSPRASTAARVVWGFGLGFSITGFTIFGSFLEQHPYFVFTAYWLFFFAVQDLVFVAPGLRRSCRAWRQRMRSFGREEAAATEPRGSSAA